MKATEALQALINLSSEKRPYENVNYIRRPREMYWRLHEILLNTENEERKQLVHSLDDMVCLMLGNSFDDGLVAGIELAATMKEILNNTEAVYLDILNSSQNSESVMKSAFDIIHKFD